MATRKVYVIVRSWWNYNDEWVEGDKEPLKAFSDRDQAEEYLRRCGWRRLEERHEYVQGGIDYKLVEMELPDGGPV